MKPLVGITMNFDVQSSRTLNLLDLDYGRSIVQAGGVPVPLPGIDDGIEDYVRRLDGFLFTGGDDIHPRFYKERPLPGVTLRLAPDERVRYEIRLFRAALKARKPILAVCYGTQLVNVALGGTLYQDIARQVRRSIRHSARSKGEKVLHPVSIFEGTRLCKIMGSCKTAGECTVRVRSAHHQSVKNPGSGLRLSAVAPDGVVEALESRGRNFLIAVQWHPEKLPLDDASGKLFAAFVAACRR